MPATTYLRAGEFTAATSNATLNVAAYLYGMLAGHDVATKHTGPAAA